MPLKKAIIIGASSGIGQELAKVVAKEGYSHFELNRLYEVGLVARRLELLLSLQKEIPNKSYIKQVDVVILP